MMSSAGVSRTANRLVENHRTARPKRNRRARAIVLELDLPADRQRLRRNVRRRPSPSQAPTGTAQVQRLVVARARRPMLQRLVLSNGRLAGVVNLDRKRVRVQSPVAIRVVAAQNDLLVRRPPNSSVIALLSVVEASSRRRRLIFSVTTFVAPSLSEPTDGAVVHEARHRGGADRRPIGAGERIRIAASDVVRRRRPTARSSRQEPQDRPPQVTIDALGPSSWNWICPPIATSRRNVQSPSVTVTSADRHRPGSKDSS